MLLNVTTFSPIAAAKRLSPESLELVHDQADLVYVIEVEGATWVAYRKHGFDGITYGFFEDRDEPTFTDEALMLARFREMVRSEYGLAEAERELNSYEVRGTVLAMVQVRAADAFIAKDLARKIFADGGGQLVLDDVSIDEVELMGV